MIRPANPTHGLKPFQMYSIGAVKRETQNIFEAHGIALVNYKAHDGVAIGRLAYVDAGIPVHTCAASDFRAWAEGSRASDLESADQLGDSLADSARI